MLSHVETGEEKQNKNVHLLGNLIKNRREARRGGVSGGGEEDGGTEGWK